VAITRSFSPDRPVVGQPVSDAAASKPAEPKLRQRLSDRSTGMDNSFDLTIMCAIQIDVESDYQPYQLGRQTAFPRRRARSGSR
jgi:hypothetical protein